MFCTYLLISKFWLAPQGWSCHWFCTGPWCITCLDSCLVSVHDVLHVFHHHADFLCFLMWCVEDKLGILLMSLFCRLYSLALLLHVAFLHFVRFNEIYISCCCYEHGPYCVEPCFYCSYPCDCSQEPCHGMVVLYNLFCAGKFKHIVYHIGVVSVIVVPGWVACS